MSNAERTDGGHSASVACPACKEEIAANKTRCPRCQTDLSALQMLDALPDHFYDQALAHARAGRMADARQSIAAALALKPDDAGAWVLQGKLAGQAGQQELATESFERALSLEPQCDAARAGRDAVAKTAARRRPPLVARAAVSAILTAVVVLGAVVFWAGRASLGTEERTTAADSTQTRDRDPGAHAGHGDPGAQAGDRDSGEHKAAVGRIRRALAAVSRSPRSKSAAETSVGRDSDGAIRLSGTVESEQVKDTVLAVARALAINTEVSDDLIVALASDEPAEAEAEKDSAKPSKRLPHLRRHRVRAGDTLWDLSLQQLGHGSRWREIAKLNSDVDPAALRVGADLRLPPRRRLQPGKPHSQVELSARSPNN